MLVYITGIPGSGKTYKAVYHIYKHFGKSSKNRDERYLFCYTNIDGFNFDVVDDRVRKLDFDALKSNLLVLHDMYKRKASDAELIERAKQFEIYKALFVVDEAHNYFQNRDPVLVWWLTYHRHLYQDIYLITQNLSLIESKYKPLAEYFYKAVPSSLRFSKKIFKYNVFVDQRMYKDSKAKVETIKLDPEVFKLYNAGDDTKSPNFLKRFVFFAFLFALITGFVFYFFIRFFFTSDTSESVSVSKSVSQSSSRGVIVSTPTQIDDSFRVINIKCFDSDCFYNHKEFDFSTLNYLVSQTSSKYLYAKKLNGTNQVLITLLASPSFINLFRSSNEKDSSRPVITFGS